MPERVIDPRVYGLVDSFYPDLPIDECERIASRIQTIIDEFAPEEDVGTIRQGINRGLRDRTPR